MERARDVAVAAVGLLILGNLLTAVFGLDGAWWYAVRAAVSAVLTVAAVAFVALWVRRRSSRSEA